jgi:hypothetical protein
MYSIYSPAGASVAAAAAAAVVAVVVVAVVLYAQLSIYVVILKCSIGSCAAVASKQQRPCKLLH